MKFYEMCSALGAYLHLKASSMYSRFMIWYEETKKLR